MHGGCRAAGSGAGGECGTAGVGQGGCGVVGKVALHAAWLWQRRASGVHVKEERVFVKGVEAGPRQTRAQHTRRVAGCHLISNSALNGSDVPLDGTARAMQLRRLQVACVLAFGWLLRTPLVLTKYISAVGYCGVLHVSCCKCLSAAASGMQICIY